MEAGGFRVEGGEVGAGGKGRQRVRLSDGRTFNTNPTHAGPGGEIVHGIWIHSLHSVRVGIQVIILHRSTK